MDKFTQLTEDLRKGSLSPSHLRTALKVYYREREDLPLEMKDILCGSNAGNPGLISGFFNLLSSVIGGMELAVLRVRQGKIDE